MLTGVEIAGIALAVTPLCITVLKNHEAELQPFKNMWKLRDEYARSQRALNLRFAQLSIQMDNLLLHSGICTDGQRIRGFVNTYSPEKWQSVHQKQKLIAHLEQYEYEHGFETIVQQIRVDIANIASILGLGAYGVSDGDAQVWTRLKTARELQNSVSRSQQGAWRASKAQAKFVFEGGKMKACLQNLDSDIEHLTRTVEGAGERQTFRDSMAASIMPTRLDLPPRLPVFGPSLARISGYAQRLHDALQSVQACPLRRSHRVNLRLESRLKSRSSNSVDDGYGTAHFTFVCESCHKDSCSWQSLEVLVSASQDADNSEHDPSSRGVRFAHEGEGTPAGPYVRGECISDLCLSMANSRPTMGEKARFYLDAGNQMVRWGNSTIPLAGEALPSELTPLRSELQTTRTPMALFTAEKISLGSDIMSAILQLSATHWLASVWSCDGLYLLESGQAANSRQVYIPMKIDSTDSTEPELDPDPEGFAFIRLGITLLEIAVPNLIKDIGFTVLASNEPLASTDRWHYIDKIETFMNSPRARADIQPCFQVAIKYCLTASARCDAGIRKRQIQDEVIRNVLGPFEFALQYWQKLA